MKNKRKLIVTSISVIAICITFIGLSYAYWYVRNIQDSTSNATTGCFQVELTNQSGEINLGNAYPITDEEGLKLKPFSFTIHNTCNIFAHYYINVELLEGTTLNSHYVATRVNNEEIKTLDSFNAAVTTIDNSVSSYTVAEGYLGADDQEDYSISLWIDEDVTVDDDIFGKIFKSKVVVNSEPGSYNPVSAGYTKLGDAILANEYQTTPDIAKTKIANKQEVDLTNTAPVIKWVEKTGENSTKSIIKISSNSINIDDATSELTENDTKLKLYTSYSFDADTAKYKLSNPIVADPTTLDYSNGTNYYIIEEDMSFNQMTKKLFTHNLLSDITMYLIKDASKSSSKLMLNNTSYDSIKYNLNVTSLTEMELETDKSDRGLYQSTDDYGTTYYYRGNVKNNNVYFAGFYWQIVRINGDGSIRLIYNGAVKNANGINQSINSKTYQFNKVYNDPAYVGYMYGDSEGTTVDEVHNNTNSSSIKIIIDNWYQNNIISNGYDDYISITAGFCGDRTVIKGDGVSNTAETTFGALGRLQQNSAQFNCPELSRDLYTTADANIGNKALTYPIGLITADELVFAGMDSKHTNRLSWIYSELNSWTMSPSTFNVSYSMGRLFYQIGSGYIHIHGWPTSMLSVRPVINLKSDVKISGGTGTSNDPFIVKTN